MPRHEKFEYSAPSPSPGATPAQSIIMGFVGGVLALVTMTGVQNSASSAIQVGSFLVTLGLLFGIGMVSKSRTVQMIVAMLLIFGGGIAIGLGANVGSWLWYVGAAFFFLCAIVVLIKDQIVERSRR
jgi:hypothetical protein